MIERSNARVARFFAFAIGPLLLAAAVLRFYDLEHNPPGLWQDEASTGLDAWLIATSGRDQHGAPWPIIARSFGDYPLAGYRYLDALVVSAFGLSIATERVVAAIAGTALVGVASAFSWLAFGSIAALGTLASAALCPTWIHFSRYGSEAILLPLTLTAGATLFEAGKRPHRRSLWIAGAICAGLSAYTYHAVKVVLPIWIIGVIVYLHKEIRETWASDRRVIVATALVFTAVVLPSVMVSFSVGGQARGRTVLAWYHHEGLELLRVIALSYLSYFDLGMLFVRGGPVVAQSIPYAGLWSLFDLPLILAALWALATKRLPRAGGFVLFWFLLGPLPGGLTPDIQNIGRAIAWLPSPNVLSGVGFAVLLGLIPVRFVSTGLAIVALAWTITLGQIAYETLLVYPRNNERDWQFEISAAMKCAKEHRGRRSIIVAPEFQLASVFARFHFYDLGEPGGLRPFSLGRRTRLGPDEIYAFPASQPKPVNGEELCSIRSKRDPTPRAFVYGSTVAADRAPSE
ncbi:MAG: hypothetical protein HY791_37825 [Deltaproteobacteria bacterium]|nr:hypothetical protein [Deltaproteobacteria bacterium]